jgi:putative phosphoribosyl transferase
MPVTFDDRLDAGRRLANKLLRYRKKAVVVALPRGGLPVGYEVARKLSVPLDTVVSRKLGAPTNPELAVGAIAPGDVLMIDEKMVDLLNISEEQLEHVLVIEKEEMEKRLNRFNSGGYADVTESENVILVDDGVATGMTTMAAIESVKLIRKPKKIILAVPVASREALSELSLRVDETECLLVVDDLQAVGIWYKNFAQVENEEVMSYLERANS